MGLPLWSSVGFGNDDNKSTATPKSEPTAPRRSPIQRSFPTRQGAIVDPNTGAVRQYRRPVVRRRAVPPQAPVPRADSETYQPNVRSPLVPSLGSLGAVLARAQRVLGLAHVEMDRLLARQYIPRLASPSHSEHSDRTLADELDTVLRSARVFSESTREQITYLVRWERNLLRGEIIGPQLSNGLHEQLENFIVDCEDDKLEIKARLEQFQSWATDAREGISNHRHSLEARLGVPQTVQPREAAPRFLNEAPISRSGSASARQTPAIVLQNHDRRSVPRSSRESSSAPRDSTVSMPDGLGDRLRSASPDNDADAWDTMRMTLEPDDRLPSTDSSFTTAAASASFSAPSERSSSSSAPLSAASSRTDLSMSLFEDEDCGPYDGRDDQHNLPEVIPSPLFRDMSGRHGGHGIPPTRNGNPPLIAGRRDRMLPPLYGERPIRDVRDRPLGSAHLSPAPNPPFMFSAPRSLSPLSFSSTNDISAGPPSASDAVNRSAANPMARPSSSVHANNGSANNPSTPGDVSAVMRLAFQYASAVASSGNPHTDPELEHMRRIFSTVANSDGQLNEDWWMSAGVAPYLADDNISPNDNQDPNNATQ